MGKYIDADRLIRSVESIGLIPQKHADYNDGRNDVIMMVLDLIDSLQQEQPELPKIGTAEDYYYKGVCDGFSKGSADALNT